MSILTDFFDCSENPNSLGAKFRNKRQLYFETLFFQSFSKNLPIRILDVGGTSRFWQNSRLLKFPNIEISLLNLQKEELTDLRFKSFAGDATNMSEFADQSFDLVFSNSVIEHVYSMENQVKMAREILRVGKRYFIQTPNRYFPIEAHYALPFAQAMPKSWVYFLLTKTRFSRLQKWDPLMARQYLDEIRLLDEKEMRYLFPNATIYREKMIGMYKSIIAHNLGSN